MRIKRITLHNFKSFENTVTIDNLDNNLLNGKNIVLFGGLNGAGKTSLFEAILLCLYGKGNKTLWPTRGTKRESYENWINSIININAKKSIFPTMWIELELKVPLGGILQSLNIRRTWKVKEGNEIDEAPIKVTNEKGELHQLFTTPDYWEDYISHELIPYEISQFFFFDGEKIQEFIKDEDKEFKESLQKVLGISLYKKLKDDLENTRKNYIVKEYNKDKESEKEIRRIETEISEIEADVQNKETEIERFEKEIEELNDAIEEINNETKRINQAESSTVEEYEKRQNTLNQKKGSLEIQIGLIIEDIPFIMLSSLYYELIEQLEKEEIVSRTVNEQKDVRPKIDETLNRFLNDPPPLTINEIQKEVYKNRLYSILENVFLEKKQTSSSIHVLHGLQYNDIEKIKDKFQKINNTINNFKRYADDLNNIDHELEQMRRYNRKTSDPTIKQKFEELGQKKNKKEHLQQQIDSTKIEINKKKSISSSKEKQKANLEEKLEHSHNKKKQIDYCKKIESVIDDFLVAFQEKKIKQLEEYTLEMCKKLSRKKDHIEKIVIDNQKFSIDLLDSEGRVLDKTKLSAGEKEIVALSLIWALAKLANRDLPVVIDTPLGRLDKQHRTKIAENYFSNLGGQILLLSTNTEIINEEYTAIEKHLSKKLLISKDSGKESSKVSEGYFESFKTTN